MFSSNGLDDLRFVLGCSWMWKTILCIILYIASWSQELVITKDLCEATITKRLAWLVAHLVVSCHESSSLFILFSNLFFNIKNTIFISYCFHLLFILLLLLFYFVFKTILQNLFLFHFLLFYFYFLVCFSQFTPVFIYFLHRCFYRLLHLLLLDSFFSFSHSLTKKNLLTYNMNKNRKCFNRLPSLWIQPVELML